MDGQRKIKDLPKGTTRTKSGHLRYTSGPERNDYIHRVIFRKLIEETPYSIRLLLPSPYEVHHMDYNKENNCPCNLLGISTSLHSIQTAHRRNGTNGKFRPKWKPTPWLPLYDEEPPF